VLDSKFELSHAKTKAFLDRFAGCGDTLVRDVLIRYSADGMRVVRVTLSTRDYVAAPDGEWVCLEIEIRNVSKYHFADEPNDTAVVIKHGINIVWSGTAVGIDFGYLVSDPETMEELIESKFFAIGQGVAWTTSAY
jgi:hypothetical protein